MIVLSKPALSYLYAQRLIEALRGTPAEALIHCESLVPSHLIRAGFSCVDLNALLPGSYRNDLMILPGRQHGVPRSLADGFRGLARMIHPVYADATFLHRMLDDCHSDAQKRDLLQRLDGAEFDLIPRPVRSRFRTKLAGSSPDPEPGMHNEIQFANTMGRDGGVRAKSAPWLGGAGGKVHLGDGC